MRFRPENPCAILHYFVWEFSQGVAGSAGGQMLAVDGIGEAVDVFQVMQIAQKKFKAVRDLEEVRRRT